MRLHPKLKLTLMFLLLMMSFGAASAWCVMKLGEESLKGVRQPDTNPTQKLSKGQKASIEPKKFVPVNEAALIKEVGQTIKGMNSSYKVVEKKDQKTQTEKQAETSKKPAETKEKTESSTSTKPEKSPEPSPQNKSTESIAPKELETSEEKVLDKQETQATTDATSPADKKTEVE